MKHTSPRQKWQLMTVAQLSVFQHLFLAVSLCIIYLLAVSLEVTSNEVIIQIGRPGTVQQTLVKESECMRGVFFQAHEKRSDGNAFVLTKWHLLCIASTAWNSSDGEWVGPLTCHIAVTVVLTILPLLTTLLIGRYPIKQMHTILHISLGRAQKLS